MTKLHGSILIVLMSFAVHAQTAESFETFKQRVRTHWAKGNLTKAIDLINDKKFQFNRTSEKHTIIYYSALLYLDLNDYEKSIKSFNEGFEQDFFFSLGRSYGDKLAKHPKGKKVILRNKRNGAKFLKTAKAKFDVILPRNYSRSKEYPLLYFLHGNNSNLQYLKNEWKDVELSRDIIVVLAQASYATSNFTFDWIENSVSRAEVARIHREILSKYSVDKSKIIVGGFSNGGRMAISLFIKQTLTTKGFIAFNPSKPKDLRELRKEFGSSMRGAIITGEKDYLLAKQISLANTLLEASFPLRLVVLPNHGHDYPKQFSKELNDSISFLMGG